MLVISSVGGRSAVTETDAVGAGVVDECVGPDVVEACVVGGAVDPGPQAASTPAARAPATADPIQTLTLRNMTSRHRRGRLATVRLQGLSGSTRSRPTLRRL